MLAGLSLQHVYLIGGDVPRADEPQGGLLGADFAVENGRYRIASVYRGENWNPGLRARSRSRGPASRRASTCWPSTARTPARTRSIASSRGRPASRRCSRSARRPDGKGSREVTVVPVDERAGAAEPGLGRREPPGGGQGDRRQGGVRLPAGHGRRGVHAVQPVLLRPGRAGRR